MTKIERVAIILPLILGLLQLPVHGESLSAELEGVTVVDSVVITGLNRHLGEPVWNLGVLLGTFGFPWVFAHNPEGERALQLTPTTPLDTVLASGADPLYLDVFSLTFDDIDPALLNTPLHEMPIISDLAGGRTQLPSVFESTGGSRSRAEPSGPITLGKWLEAEGRAFFRCHADGTGWVRIQFENLVPIGLYYIYGVFVLNGTQLAGIPIGGVPNIVVTDFNGNAVYDRLLNFCPSQPTAEERLLYISADYHSDSTVHGAAAHQALDPNFPLPNGLSGHSHLGFPINVTPLP